MEHSKRLIFVLTLIIAVFALAACGTAPEEEELEAPYVLEPIEGTEFNKVILTEKAAERLGIETVAAVSGSLEIVIPYSAIIYDINGGTWVYIMSDTLTYQRTSITVKRIDGDKAILSSGLEAGTEVVTTGVAELYGTDTGVGK